MTRQYLVPGFGYLNDNIVDEYLVPGWGYIDGTATPAPSSGRVPLITLHIAMGMIKIASLMLVLIGVASGRSGT